MLPGDGGHGVKPLPTVLPIPDVYENVSAEGLRALWVVFAIMVVASILFSALAWSIPVSRRLYHIITTLITITAALSYFAMATDHATSYNCVRVCDHHKHVPDTYHDVCRQVYWARYVDWSITTPLLLLDLCLLAGVDGAHTLMAIAADIVMTLTGLFAAFGHERSSQKWGWYAIACVAYLTIIWHVGVHGARSVRAKGAGVRKLFGGLGAFTLILWTIYPVVWGIAEGARKASVDSEIIAYAVLDILAKPVFGLWLLIAHRTVSETNVEIVGYWSQGISNEGQIRLGDEEEAA